MIRVYTVAFTVAVCSVMGCKSSSQEDSFHSFRLPTLREQLGVTPDTKSETRVGYLSEMAMQHPSLSKQDDYLDLYDEHGNWRNQIVIVFEDSVTPPKDRTKPIEVKGPIGHIDLGGPKGTKSEYANDVVFVESWRQLDPKDVPRKKDVEPKPDGDGKPAP